MLSAITHDVSPGIERCELTHLECQPIDVDIAKALELYRQLRRTIKSPGTLDDGDVLRVGRMLYVGLSRRSSKGS